MTVQHGKLFVIRFFIMDSQGRVASGYFLQS